MEQQEPDATDELQQRLQEISRFIDEQDWTEAYRALLDAEERHPRDPTLLCLLGAVATEMEARPLAYDYFRRCLAEQPTDPHVLVTLGVGLARYDDPDAEGVLRLAALTAPDLPQARLQYGAYLAREGMTDLAVAELTAAHELDPSNPAAPRDLAVAYLLRGDAPAVLDALEQAVGVGGEEDPQLSTLYGLSLLQNGRVEEAAEQLHRAGAEEPDDGEVQLASALACAAMEWWDHAWDALARAELAAAPADPDLLREAEDALEAGPEAAEELLQQQVGPVLLRERLLRASDA